jgi:hypothetical protein
MTSIILPSNTTDPSQITSNTLPTTRTDGSALQIGDRWYKPSMGQEGFWNGTLWLTINQFNLSGAVSTAAASGGSNHYNVSQQSLGGGEIFGGMFVRNLRIKYRAVGTITLQNSSNHRRIAFTIRGSSNAIRTFNFNASYLLDGVQYPFATNDYQFIEIPINAVVPENDLAPIVALSGIVGSPNFTMDSAFSFDIRGIMV